MITLFPQPANYKDLREWAEALTAYLKQQDEEITQQNFSEYSGRMTLQQQIDTKSPMNGPGNTQDFTTRDLRVQRDYSPGTGAIFFGSGNAYIHYDGSNTAFNIPSGSLYSNGGVVITTLNFLSYFTMRRLNYGASGLTAPANWSSSSSIGAYGTFVVSFLIYSGSYNHYVNWMYLQWAWNGTYYTIGG